LDYVEKNGDNDIVRYDNHDILFFKIGDTWISEYSANIFEVADIADMLGIKCPEE
jgi:hypothetical protein